MTLVHTRSASHSFPLPECFALLVWKVYDLVGLWVLLRSRQSHNSVNCRSKHPMKWPFPMEAVGVGGGAPWSSWKGDGSTIHWAVATTSNTCKTAGYIHNMYIIHSLRLEIGEHKAALTTKLTSWVAMPNPIRSQQLHPARCAVAVITFKLGIESE